MDKILIANWKCYICYNLDFRKSSIVYLGMNKNSEKFVREISKEVLKLTKKSFMLVAYEVEDWDAYFSPWYTEMENNKRIFLGNGNQTLHWLLEQCIPYVEEIYIKQIVKKDNIANNHDKIKKNNRYLVGYSLAGLFSLWAFYECKQFEGVASCSSSLWYPGWKEYIMHKDFINGGKVYFSLGKKEEKTRNSMMAQIGEVTRFQYNKIASSIYERQRVNESLNRKSNIQTILEWHEGGHFHQVEQRIAKGIAWLLNSNSD